MTEGDKLIWDAMPETMPDVEGSKRFFDRERGFLYKDKDGKVVGLWDYNTYKLDDPNPRYIRKAWVDEETKELKFLDPRDEVNPERIKYPEIIKVTLVDKEGKRVENKYNGVELHTTARNYKLNPVLTREVIGEEGDLAQMMAILEEAYRLKLIPQFVEGAMKPENLEASGPFHEKTLSKPIYVHKTVDKRAKRWRGEGLLPYTPIVCPAPADVEMRWAPVLMKQADDSVAGWWGISLNGRVDGAVVIAPGVKSGVQTLLDNGILATDGGGLGGRLGNGSYSRCGIDILLPMRIKDQGALNIVAKNNVDSQLLEMFNELQSVSTQQRSAYLSILSGYIPIACKDGTYPAITDFYIATD